MRITIINTIAYMVAAAVVEPVWASQQTDSKGVIEDSKTSLVLRNVYMNRDFRQRGAAQSYGEEWGQGFIGSFQSGFTQGSVGFGFDILGKLGIRLDTGDGRTGGGTGLLEQDQSGAKANYSKIGGAVKARVSNSVLKFGDQVMTLPILSTNDARLLPETASGLSLSSNEIKNMTLYAGHFTGLTRRNDSKQDNASLTVLDYLGTTYRFNDQWVGSVFYQHVENYWRKYYSNVNFTVGLGEGQALNLDFNMYDTKSTGEARAGELDNRIWSLSSAYSIGAHRFMIAHQAVSGRGDYTYGIDGLSTVLVANSIQYSDFNYEDEKSWQMRYDLNMAPYGVPGLSFMTRYIKGYDFNTAATDDGKAWERNVEAKYVVQSGAVKNMSVRLRSATYRSADRGGDVDEMRVIIEYPLDIF